MATKKTNSQKATWIDRKQLMMASKDDKINISIIPNNQGDYSIHVDCGAWQDIKSAKIVSSLLLAILLDEHGYAREIEDLTGDIKEMVDDIGSTPKTTRVNSSLKYLTVDQAKQLHERYKEKIKTKNNRNTRS